MDMDRYVENFYNTHDNYQVIDNPNAAEADLCYIYFSSIAMFTEKNYLQRLESDYYEFHRNPAQRAGRHIYVRDVTRAVYLCGISAKHNTIEKLLALLAELTQGYRVITVGVSGGGYMAMLAGARLKAECVLSISGVVHLDHVQDYFDEMPAWINWNQPEKQHWFNIVSNLKDCGVDIIQFDAALNPQDVENAQLMKEIASTKAISVNYLHHAGEVDPPSIGQLINLNHQQLLALYEHFKGRTISKLTLNWYLLPLPKFIAFYGKKLRKNFLKLKFSKKGILVVVLGISFINTTGSRE